MGRKPVGKKAMTDAERQRRRRKKARKEKLKLGKKAEKEKKRLKNADDYIPTPPGITYWYRVQVGERTLWAPTTQPLASVKWGELREEDLRCLIEMAGRELECRAKGVANVNGGGVSVCNPGPPVKIS
jgi:hypothetical protein